MEYGIIYYYEALRDLGDWCCSCRVQDITEGHGCERERGGSAVCRVYVNTNNGRQEGPVKRTIPSGI